MIDYVAMIARLNRIGKFYNKTKNVETDKIVSKLVLMEVCGWIEQYVDNKIFDYLTIKQLDSENRIKEKINKVHNMAYNDFLSIIGCVIGYLNIIEIEHKHPNEYNRLQSNLNKLHSSRNKMAHESIDSNTNILSPQVVVSIFADIKVDMDVYFTEINCI